MIVTFNRKRTDVFMLTSTSEGGDKNERKPENEFIAVSSVHTTCIFTEIKHLLYSKLTSGGERNVQAVSFSLTQPAGKIHTLRKRES